MYLKSYYSMHKYCNIEALFRELAYWLSILVTRKRTVYADTVKLFEEHHCEFNVED